MPAWEWATITVAAVAYLVMFRVAFRSVFATEGDTWGDVCLCLWLATAFAIPIVLGMAAQHIARAHDPTVFARKVAGESRDQKRRRCERELADREARVRALEREVGIEPDNSAAQSVIQIHTLRS